MEGERKRSDLESLLEAIKSSEVLESRISLISQLGDSYRSETSDLAFLLEHLATFWENSTCLDISQCLINKTILHVASKYLELDAPDCLDQFLILGTKASVWCGKHLQMTIMSIEESQDEKHSSLFFQLILDSLSFSSTTISVLARSPILGEKVVMLIVENFILEQLNLTKASISEIKKIHAVASEVLKVAQVVLDSLIKLCRAYSQAIRWDFNEKNIDGNEGSVDCEVVDYANHIKSIVACAIENLYELGILAASGGGSLVTILNVSWKGVVSLLQLGKGVLAEKINVGDIILTLVSLATESLRCTAEAWSSTLREAITISEAKRAFLPIKFYLINAVRISSEYPCEAVNVYREVTRCVLMISSLGISLSKESHLRAASEALTEFLEPTSFLLLHAILNSTDVKLDSKIQILDWLFPESVSNLIHLEENVDTAKKSTSLESIFTEHCDARPIIEALILGRVILFLNLLKSSPVLREEVVLGISRKLDCLLIFFMHEDVYSSILGLHIPVLCSSGANPGVAWQPMFPFTLHALKTFMIVAASTNLVWMEVEYFLLQNLFHPHFLSREIVTELLCFLMRHAEKDMANYILDRLCLLLKSVALSEPVLMPLCTLRKMARSVCILLTYATSATVDQVYTSILGDDKSYLSSVIYMALLMEGFPLNSLSNNLKMLATRRIATAFQGFIDSDFNELGLNGSLGSRGSGLPGLPVLALSSALNCCHIKSSDIIDDKNISQVVKFAVLLIHACRSATNSMKDHCIKLLSATLDIISNMKHLYSSGEMEEVVFELQSLFVADSADADASLYQCKPSLASFMASLSHMEIAEGEGSALCSAIWDLYHMLLRDRHWAFVHLAMDAFGYFAARTSCSQLWRFVPRDAALSFDIDTGNHANEERFMSELKAFLEKEVALHVVTPCKEQLSLLVKEGIPLMKEVGNMLNTIPEASEFGVVEINDENCMKSKKRKLPDGICEGIEMLESGLKVMNNALAQADSAELNDALSTHVSCLEDVISHLVNLSDKV